MLIQFAPTGWPAPDPRPVAEDRAGPLPSAAMLAVMAVISGTLAAASMTERPMKRSTQIGSRRPASCWSRRDGRCRARTDRREPRLRQPRPVPAPRQADRGQCEQRFREARRAISARRRSSRPRPNARPNTAPACERRTSTAPYVVPALAGFVLARASLRAAGQAQPLLPPTRRLARRAAPDEECQRRAPPPAAAEEAAASGRARPPHAPIRRPRATHWSRAGSSPAPRRRERASRGGFGSTGRSFRLLVLLDAPRCPRAAAGLAGAGRAARLRLPHARRRDLLGRERRLCLHAGGDRARHRGADGEIEQLCFAFIERAIEDEEILTRLAIPPRAMAADPRQLAARRPQPLRPARPRL